MVSVSPLLSEPVESRALARPDPDEVAFGMPVVNCGVRVVEGRHRTYVTDFIRNARAGGCAVGTPPANLGFRLVRDQRGWEWLRTARAFLRVGGA